MLELDDMLRLGAQPVDTLGELSPLGEAVAAAPPTVLVVDDDRAVREVLSAVLKEEGYSVRQAASAEMALELLRGDQGLPLVLCDVKMPDRDGFWLLDQVMQRHPQAAVVMLTGYGDTESAVECLKRGASDYLLKPPRVTELVRAVERAWSRSKLASARARYH
jgi:DNA-binding NtrC family response regulator